MLITKIPVKSSTVKFREYNPETDDVRNLTCWRCGDEGHASFMCNLPPPQPGLTIAPLRNTSRHSQDSNDQRNTPFSHSRNITDGNDAILPVAAPSLFLPQFIQKSTHSSTEAIGLENIDFEQEGDETSNAVIVAEENSKSIHVPRENSVSKDNENDLLEVPNYQKRKIEKPGNIIKAVNRSKVEPMLGNLKGNETLLKNQLDLLISARAETTHNVCERHLANEPGFEFHRHLHSLTPMF
ncbi:hypothetical protein AVEN_244519-1 [Araneus ventricosus]|uniref:CCHC-type domain-containing protein n=1 Tax=Araneus ventricosus TaxID=182803 RepID=A0A4Y2F3F2_ARAVE|nr:hypothetical protein AVEN_244519-1 [Araneus ventricosus]